MFKQLKIYYVLVTLPFALVLMGAVVFSNGIRSTIVSNPHPQINYAIFIIILVGGGLIVFSVDRLVREARILQEFSAAIRSKSDLAALQQMAGNYTGDVSCLLQMIAASGGRSISHQEQAAIEHELNNARSRLNRRNSLPQYLTGLLVGMGLLGTFIGLLATLNDISVLISSFADLDMSDVSPILVFRTMIERMRAPMQSMGIAFSASMYGLLGSITLGLMMVGIRRLQADIFSLLGSEVARHIEVALSYETINVGSGPVYTGDEFKVLLRIEERLAEAVRLQQRALASEMEDFQKQRADMVRAVSESTEASNSFVNELQQLGRQLGSLLKFLESGNHEISAQLSEVTVQLAADAKESQKLANVVERQGAEALAHLSDLKAHLNANASESHKLMSLQADEQKKLRDTLDSYKIEERLAETARVQQRTMASVIEDFQKQRADMLRTLDEQNEASKNFRAELQQLGRQLGTLFTIIEKGNSEICSQVSELMVHRATDAKESLKLLAMQVNEQRRLRESVDSRVNGGNS